MIRGTQTRVCIKFADYRCNSMRRCVFVVFVLVAVLSVGAQDEVVGVRESRFLFRIPNNRGEDALWYESLDMGGAGNPRAFSVNEGSDAFIILDTAGNALKFFDLTGRHTRNIVLDSEFHNFRYGLKLLPISNDRYVSYSMRRLTMIDGQGRLVGEYPADVLWRRGWWSAYRIGTFIYYIDRGGRTNAINLDGEIVGHDIATRSLLTFHQEAIRSESIPHDVSEAVRDLIESGTHIAYGERSYSLLAPRMERDFYRIFENIRESDVVDLPNNVSQGFQLIGYDAEHNGYYTLLYADESVPDRPTRLMFAVYDRFGRRLTAFHCDEFADDERLYQLFSVGESGTIYVLEPTRSGHDMYLIERRW